MQLIIIKIRKIDIFNCKGLNNMNGIIVIGYQGIGKTSLVARGLANTVIDFESSLFKVDDKKNPDWYKIYCRQAVSIAKQGFTVLISSHKCVREELTTYKQDGFAIVTITPTYALKDKWIDRLEKRYKKDPNDKNFAAWKNAEEHFIENVNEIASEPAFSHIFIDSMDYSLRSILNSLSTIFSSRTRYTRYRLDDE